MSNITPEQLDELEVIHSKAEKTGMNLDSQRLLWSARLHMPALVAAARELEEIKSGKCAKWTIEVEQDRDHWKEKSDKHERIAKALLEGCKVPESVQRQIAMIFCEGIDMKAIVHKALGETAGQRGSES